MEHPGTLLISRGAEARLRNRIYFVTFLSVGDQSTFRGHRCRGDMALVKTLEELISGADVRLRALEEVRGAGRASIADIVLSEEQVTKYGLGPRRRPSALGALGGRPAGSDPAELSARDLTEEVARFLSERPGRPFCHTCLAALISIEFEDARKAVYALRISGEVRVVTARCSICHRHRVSIKAMVIDQE